MMIPILTILRHQDNDWQSVYDDELQVTRENIVSIFNTNEFYNGNTEGKIPNYNTLIRQCAFYHIHGRPSIYVLNNELKRTLIIDCSFYDLSTQYDDRVRNYGVVQVWLNKGEFVGIRICGQKITGGNEGCFINTNIQEETSTERDQLNLTSTLNCRSESHESNNIISLTYGIISINNINSTNLYTSTSAPMKFVRSYQYPKSRFWNIVDCHSTLKGPFILNHRPRIRKSETYIEYTNIVNNTVSENDPVMIRFDDVNLRGGSEQTEEYAYMFRLYNVNFVGNNFTHIVSSESQLKAFAENCFIDNTDNLFPYTFSSNSTITDPKESSFDPFDHTLYYTENCFHSFPETPFQTPFITALETPVHTLDQTPHLTPFNTQEATLHFTPLSTPFNTQGETPHLTPYNTKEVTPHLTPFSTPFNTQEETPHFTPHLTPFNTQEETHHLTPFSTPFNT